MSNNKAASLDAYLCEQEAGTFDWSANNCCHFVQRWVQREEHFTADLVPKSKDRKAAMRLIHDYGGIEAAVSRALRRQPIPAACARSGDVVLFRGIGTIYAMLGLCCGRTAACLGEGTGNIVHIEMKNARTAWRVGGGEAP